MYFPVPSVVYQSCAEVILVYVLHPHTSEVLEYSLSSVIINSAALNTNVLVGIETSFKSYTLVEDGLP